RPIRAREQKECRAADQRGTQMRVVPRMPEAGANGAAETLHGQMSGSFLRGMPPDERSDNAEIADRIDPERRSNAQAGHDDAAQCRPDCATHLEAPAVR